MGNQAHDRPTFITTPSGDEIVIMTRPHYDRLVASSRDDHGDDVHIALSRKAEWERAGKPAAPLAVIRRVRAGESFARAFRSFRGLTQEALAAKAGIAQGYLSGIETGRKTPNEATRLALAAALDIHPVFLSDDAPGLGR